MNTPRKSRLAQAAFVVAFVDILQFFLHLAPAITEKFDGVEDVNLALPARIAAGLSGLGVLLGAAASYRIKRTDGALKGLGYSVTATFCCLFLISQLLALPAALSRLKNRAPSGPANTVNRRTFDTQVAPQRTNHAWPTLRRQTSNPSWPHESAH